MREKGDYKTIYLPKISSKKQLNIININTNFKMNVSIIYPQHAHIETNIGEKLVHRL